MRLENDSRHSREHRLRTAIDAHTAVAFPDPPADPELHELYTQLIEYDGYIVGLATSALHGRDSPTGAHETDGRLRNMMQSYREAHEAGAEEIVLPFVRYLD